MAFFLLGMLALAVDRATSVRSSFSLDVRPAKLNTNVLPRAAVPRVGQLQTNKALRTLPISALPDDMLAYSRSPVALSHFLRHSLLPEQYDTMTGTTNQLIVELA